MINNKYWVHNNNSIIFGNVRPNGRIVGIVVYSAHSRMQVGESVNIQESMFRPVTLTELHSIDKLPKYFQSIGDSIVMEGIKIDDHITGIVLASSHNTYSIGMVNNFKADCFVQISEDEARVLCDKINNESILNKGGISYIRVCEQCGKREPCDLSHSYCQMCDECVKSHPRNSKHSYYIKDTHDSILLGWPTHTGFINGIIVNVKEGSCNHLGDYSDEWMPDRWIKLESNSPVFPPRKVKKASALIFNPNGLPESSSLFNDDATLNATTAYSCIVKTVEKFANMAEVKAYLKELSRSEKYPVQLIQFPFTIDSVEQWMEVEE